MRLLLMISNSNMGIREVYTAVLHRDFPGWGTSTMSGLPANPGAIIRGYDAVVYELYKPDDPQRYKSLLSLWPEIKDFEPMHVITHIDGPYRAGITADLQEQGVIVVDDPFSPDTVAAALRHIAPVAATGTEQSHGVFSRLFGRKNG